MNGRSTGGKFGPGNRAAAGRGSHQNGMRFAAWARQLFEDPERRKRLVERVDREIAGDGPAPMVTKLLEFGFGTPAAIAQTAVYVHIEKLARLTGLSSETLLAEARRLAEAAERQETTNG